VPIPEANEEPKTDPISEDPISEVYYKLNVLSSLFTGEIDYWVILHNDRKELLDYKKFEVGDNLMFESSVDSITENISVTFLRYRQDQNGNVYYMLDSDLNIPKGTNRDFGFISGPSTPAPNKTGDFDVTISDIPILDKINITSNNRPLFESFGGFNGIDPYTFNESISKYEGYNEYFISTLDGNNELKYLDFENEDGSEVTFDYADFKLFDSYHDITLPDYNSYYLYIAGHEDANDEAPSFWLHSVLSNLDTNIQSNPLKYGYLDRFAKSTTSFSIKMDEYEYRIVRKGDKLENISVPPKPDLSWQNESVFEFDFISDISFIKSVHRWSFSQGDFSQNNAITTSWRISHQMDTKPNTLSEVPLEILETYPDLNIGSLNYDNSILTIIDEKGLNYDFETITIFNQ